ncbi:hypothetical protein JCM10212_001883 [Sporobolomyces blumeae]
MASQESLTTIQLANSLVGWLATACAVWLLVPSLFEVIKNKPRELAVVEMVYFGLWLTGDILHLTALLLEGAGVQQWMLYIFIALFESLILVFVLYYAYGCCCRGRRRKEDHDPRYGLAAGIAGFGVIFPPRDDPAPKPRRSNLPRWVWAVVMAGGFGGAAIVVWVAVALERWIVVDPPSPSHMPSPEKPLEQLAYAFAWIGLGCWIAPRIYVLCLKPEKDTISTKGVVIGVGAHFLNMTSIAILNTRSRDSILAQLPFFLTSAVCAVLDTWRLIRKRRYETSKSPAVEDKRQRRSRRTTTAPSSDEEAASRGTRSPPPSRRRSTAGSSRRLSGQSRGDSTDEQPLGADPKLLYEGFSPLLIHGLPGGTIQKLESLVGRTSGEPTKKDKAAVEGAVEAFEARRKEYLAGLRRLLEDEESFAQAHKSRRHSATERRETASDLDARFRALLPTETRVPPGGSRKDRTLGHAAYTSIAVQKELLVRALKFVYGHESEKVREDLDRVDPQDEHREEVDVLAQIERCRQERDAAQDPDVDHQLQGVRSGRDRRGIPKLPVDLVRRTSRISLSSRPASRASAHSLSHHTRSDDRGYDSYSGSERSDEFSDGRSSDEEFEMGLLERRDK